MNEVRVGGLAGWVLGRLRRGPRPEPRLALLERITLGPRQSLSLIEADGRRVLVATSPEGAPAFHALDVGSAPKKRVGARAKSGNRVGSTTSIELAIEPKFKVRAQ